MFLKIFSSHFILVKWHWELLWLFCLFSKIYIYIYIYLCFPIYLYTHVYVFMYTHTQRETSKICICLCIYTNTLLCMQVFCTCSQGETDSAQFPLYKTPFYSPLWSDLSAGLEWPICLSWLILLQKVKAENSFFCSWLLLQVINMVYSLHTNRNKCAAEIMVLTYNQRLKAIWAKTKTKSLGTTATFSLLS